MGKIHWMTTHKKLNERDTKLVMWLSEAHAKEAELEADLTVHIGLTEKASYRKRLQQHLKETREHKRSTAKRVRELGGELGTGSSMPGVPNALGEMAGKTLAAVKGQVGAARALVTSQPETHLRNLQEELREEHVEIAIYTRIETLATEVGDRETAQLARGVRRDEERMAKYLDGEMQRLVKEIVRDEIPRDQRATPPRRRTTAGSSRSRRRASGASTGRSTTGRSTGGRSHASANRSSAGSSRSSTGSTR